MELTWSLDYCLACDRQTSGGAYCSQSCRLADHETSSWSGPSSSKTAGNTITASTTSPSTAPSSASPPSSAKHPPGSGFYLSPAINFDLYKTSTASSPPASTSSVMDHPTSTSPPRLLSPSSSHSSLSSTQSSSSPRCNFSQQVHNELRAYTNSFDTTRNWRRRRTWS